MHFIMKQIIKEIHEVMTCFNMKCMTNKSIDFGWCHQDVYWEDDAWIVKYGPRTNKWIFTLKI